MQTDNELLYWLDMVMTSGDVMAISREQRERIEVLEDVLALDPLYRYELTATHIKKELR